MGMAKQKQHSVQAAEAALSLEQSEASTRRVAAEDELSRATQMLRLSRQDDLLAGSVSAQGVLLARTEVNIQRLVEASQLHRNTTEELLVLGDRHTFLTSRATALRAALVSHHLVSLSHALQGWVGNGTSVAGDRLKALLQRDVQDLEFELARVQGESMYEKDALDKADTQLADLRAKVPCPCLVSYSLSSSPCEPSTLSLSHMFA